MDWYRKMQMQNVLEFNNFERREVTGTSVKLVSRRGDDECHVYIYLKTAPHVQVMVFTPKDMDGDEASLEVYYEPIKDYSSFPVKGVKMNTGLTRFMEVFTLPMTNVDFQKTLPKLIPELTRNFRVILKHAPEAMPAVELRTRRKRWK